MPQRLPLPRRACARVAVALLVAVVVAPVPASALAGDPRGAIPWRDRFEAALAEARAEGRAVWVQFTGPWCLFCRRMDHDTFARPSVVARAREWFVPVKVHSDDREDLMARFGVTGLPTTVLLSPRGEVIGRLEGFAGQAEFVAFLDGAKSRVPAPSSEPALGGFCPVRLVESQTLVPGLPDVAARYDGQLYRFADATARASFLRDPERFVPAGGGRCVVTQHERGEAVAGDPRRGVYYRGRLYLCADEDARTRFAADPGRYADLDLADAGYCPHCRGREGRLVPGRPQFAATHAGRRYLFPDATHREAFRAAPEDFVRR